MQLRKNLNWYEKRKKILWAYWMIFHQRVTKGGKKDNKINRLFSDHEQWSCATTWRSPVRKIQTGTICEQWTWSEVVLKSIVEFNCTVLISHEQRSSALHDDRRGRGPDPPGVDLRAGGQHCLDHHAALTQTGHEGLLQVWLSTCCTCVHSRVNNMTLIVLLC